MKNRSHIGLLLALLLQAATAAGEIKLPRLLSDGMVLQRDAATNIWGWASPSEEIAIEIAGTIYRTAANAAGEWQIFLKPLPAGGPHRLAVRGRLDSAVVSNILVGEVWVCSGQSNMELPMRRVRPLYEADIAAADNPMIRQFTVPQRYDFLTPQADFPAGNWQTADRQSVLSFSATAYFFAKEIFEKYHVPVGLIHVSLGGSTAESWMSEAALQAFPHHLAEAKKYRDNELIQKNRDRRPPAHRRLVRPAAAARRGFQKSGAHLARSRARHF